MNFVKLFVTALLVSVPVFGYAFSITEVMYDLAGTDGGREWIEVQNTTNSTQTLSKWRFYENNTAHKIKFIQGSDTVNQDEYAVIADDAEKFLSDWPDYNGVLFESAFSLTNTGETLVMQDAAGNTYQTLAYGSELGAAGDGLSLQVHDGELIPAEPTPGRENATEAVITEDKQEVYLENTQTLSTHAHQVTLSEKESRPFIEISAGRERSVSIHTPVDLFAMPQRAGRNRVKFYWNMGDGTVEKGRKVHHMYEHPGIYNVVLKAVLGSQRATSRTKIHAYKPQISSIIATSSDPTVAETSKQAIAIHNSAPFEVNIGGFSVKNKKEVYIFPEDTIIDPLATVYFPNKLEVFSPTTTLRLYYPNGDLY